MSNARVFWTEIWEMTMLEAGKRWPDIKDSDDYDELRGMPCKSP
jgi:hypothetical protein